MVSEYWADMYTVVDTFTDSAFRPIIDIPENELFAVPVRVTYIIKDINGRQGAFFHTNLLSILTMKKYTEGEIAYLENQENK